MSPTPDYLKIGAKEEEFEVEKLAVCDVLIDIICVY